MGAQNTPLPDLIELSSINANATFSTAPGGGGDILGVTDTATYTGGDRTNSSSQIGELNETFSRNGGTLTIDGTEYNIQLAVPAGADGTVTVTYDGGGSTTHLNGNDYVTEIAFIIASPVGGGADRYFAVIDDGIGDLPDITSIQTRDLDFNPRGDDVHINLDRNQHVAPVCFTPGTQILTPSGCIAIETLRPGDLVLTEADGPQPIRWIGMRTMKFTPDTGRHRPVRIKAGALGGGVPWRDMAVSPQHCIVFEGQAVQSLFSEGQVLARAKGLTGLRGIQVMKGRRQATYISLLLDRHQVITAEGVRTESLYAGAMALRALSRPQRLEIEAIFPTLRDDPERGYGPTACKVLTRQVSARLAQRLRATPALSDTRQWARAERSDWTLDHAGFRSQTKH